MDPMLSLKKGILSVPQKLTPSSLHLIFKGSQGKERGFITCVEGQKSQALIPGYALPQKMCRKSTQPC